MAVKALGYFSMADALYPWLDEGFYGVDFARYRRLAETIDRGGFFGALAATWPNDPLVSASLAMGVTTRMRFRVAVYAGTTPAKLPAEQALTFDAASGGRLLFNHITPPAIASPSPRTCRLLGRAAIQFLDSSKIHCLSRSLSG